MNTQMSKQQIESYRENGFLIIEDFLSPPELETWRLNVQEAVDQRLAEAKEKLNQVIGSDLTNQGDPEDFYAQVFTQVMKLADTHAGMRKLLFDPNLGRMIAELAGVDGIRIWHDQALFKMPYGNPTPWHLDTPYWGFSSRDAVSIWIALDDATIENGCMWYVPGSYKTATFANSSFAKNMADLFKIYPDWKKLGSVPAPIKAGSAAIHNGICAHAAGANMTNGSRRAMTCGYMPDGCTWNGQQNILPQEYTANLKVGDVLNDPVINPLIWPAT